ncbi:hypothetical protein Ancab_029913 [Ancistrocladus abbreviatus]
MEEAKSLAQHQHQQLMLQHQQQQQLLLLQQLQQQQQQLQKQQQQAAISRFPSNIDAHLRPLGLNRSLTFSPNSNTSPNPNPNPNPNPSSIHHLHQPSHTNPNSNAPPQQQQLQQKMSRIPPHSSSIANNQTELLMAYHDAWRVCHPDFKRAFSSIEDACERLLPYHVVADYEAEEDDKILDSDTTGQMLSRSQQWDHNIAAKVAEFAATFEKQALAFNIITRKRASGEFRLEERLMIEQALLQEEKRSMMELRAELESREKAGRDAHEAKLRMAALQAEQARAESNVHAELMVQAPIRGSACRSQSNDAREITDPKEQGVDPDEMMNGWGNNVQRDEKEPSEDFLNDEEAENGDTGMQEWREAGDLDLNSR